jgi:hypothetical protein
MTEPKIATKLNIIGESQHQLSQPLHALHRHTGGQRSPYRRSTIAIQAVSDRHTGGQRSPHRSILLDCLVCYCFDSFWTYYIYYYMMPVIGSLTCLLHQLKAVGPASLKAVGLATESIPGVLQQIGPGSPMVCRSSENLGIGISPISNHRSATRDTTTTLMGNACRTNVGAHRSVVGFKQYRRRFSKDSRYPASSVLQVAILHTPAVRCGR